MFVKNSFFYDRLLTHSLAGEARLVLRRHLSPETSCSGTTSQTGGGKGSKMKIVSKQLDFFFEIMIIITRVGFLRARIALLENNEQEGLPSFLLIIHQMSAVLDLKKPTGVTRCL